MSSVWQYCFRFLFETWLDTNYLNYCETFWRGFKNLWKLLLATRKISWRKNEEFLWWAGTDGSSVLPRSVTARCIRKTSCLRQAYAHCSVEIWLVRAGIYITQVHWLDILRYTISAQRRFWDFVICANKRNIRMNCAWLFLSSLLYLAVVEYREVNGLALDDLDFARSAIDSVAKSITSKPVVGVSGGRSKSIKSTHGHTGLKGWVASKRVSSRRWQFINMTGDTIRYLTST